MAVLALGVLGSQAGHLLAYQLRFGAAAQQVQSTGAHAYFPALVKRSLGLAALGLLAGMLIVGAARVINGRHIEPGSQPSYVGLLAALFTIQLAFFVAQEVAESIIAGSATGSVAQLILWGTLGQLPVAAFAALALRWLSARVDAAVGAIGEVIATLRLTLMPAPLAIPIYAAPDRALLMSRVAGASLAKRGPPSFLQISSD